MTPVQEAAEILTATAFTVGETPYPWRDVVLAAMRWGEWAEVEDAAARGLACQRRAETEEIALPSASRAQAAIEFRYARGLVAAEEMRAWLSRWGLGLDDWSAWIGRDLLRARWAAETAAIVARYTPSTDEIAAVAWTEGVCSGALERAARTLAGRVAACAAMTEAGVLEARTLPAVDVTSAQAEVMQHALGMAVSADCGARLAHLAAIDQAYEAFRARMVTPAAIEAAIAGHRLEWIGLELELAGFQAEGAAREAAWCVREDGAALADVAREAGARFARQHLTLGEAAPALRAHLLGAEAGDLLGPLAADGGIALVLVRARRLPDSAEPAVRRRAERQVLEDAIRREVDGRVHWRREP